jgi:serine dehydrogenase proteinase
MSDQKQQEIEILAGKLAASSSSDVLFYNGPIEAQKDVELIDLCQKIPRRSPNIVLFITTNGGSADCAYRMARCLQRNYEKITLVIPGPCFSAGTLLAIGAHELAISHHGMLGPLDVQIMKPDELWEASSGLTVPQAMDTLQGRASSLFEMVLMQLKFLTVGQITLKTAMEISSKLTVGLLQPIYAQIEPMRLGEHDRLMRVAQEYGQRLESKSKNFKRGDTLERLLTSYPSHDFVIDREEAKTLFKNVREPSAEEAALYEALGDFARRPKIRPADARVMFLASSQIVKSEEPDEHKDTEATPAGGKPESAAAHPTPAEEPVGGARDVEGPRPHLVGE